MEAAAPSASAVPLVEHLLAASWIIDCHMRQRVALQNVHEGKSKVPLPVCKMSESDVAFATYWFSHPPSQPSLHAFVRVHPRILYRSPDGERTAGFDDRRGGWRQARDRPALDGIFENEIGDWAQRDARSIKYAC